MNENDIEIAREYISTLSNRNPDVPLRFKRRGYTLYESDGGVFFAVKKGAPDEAHALASTAAQGDPDANDVIYHDTDAEVEAEYKVKYGDKTSSNSPTSKNKTLAGQIRKMKE